MRGRNTERKGSKNGGRKGRNGARKKRKREGEKDEGMTEETKECTKKRKL